MSIRRDKVSASQKIIVILMGIFILIPGGIGFGEKLYQFFHVLYGSDSGGRFALVPIAAYVLISAGFCFLLIWGATKGMLSDIEGPKYQMLDHEIELDALEKETVR